MTDQTQTPEVRAAQAERDKSILQSMLGETKQIAAGLTERCSQIAAERDIQANDANQLRQIVQQQAEQLTKQEEKIKSLVADLAESSSKLVPPAPTPRKLAAASN